MTKYVHIWPVLEPVLVLLSLEQDYISFIVMETDNMIIFKVTRILAHPAEKGKYNW